MKKLIGIALSCLMASTLASCGNSEEFVPSMDKDTACKLKVVGEYGNFEALEAEIENFRTYYPNVQITYSQLKSYEKNIAVHLESEKPNIFFSYTWMMGNDKYSSVVSHMEELSDPSLKINLDCLRSNLVKKDENNKVFMAPIYSRTYGALVNNSIFEKENLSVPTTWSELNNVVTSLKEKNYKNPLMGYSKGDSSSFMNTIAYPMFITELSDKPEALAKANNLESEAGEYMRGALTTVKELIDKGSISLDECDKIADNYTKVILRFFEGDVPMMICTADTVSGTKKREKESEAFSNNPFAYSFVPFPSTDKGGYFIDSPSIQFSVNKECADLDMTNEFMRFIFTNKTLKGLAEVKRLVAPTKVRSFDDIYSAFAKIPDSRTISPEKLGVKDALAAQIRLASFKVGRGEMSIKDAIANYGKF